MVRILGDIMANKRRGLGRGLDALLGGPEAEVGGNTEAGAAEGELQEISLADLHPGKYQPRRDIEPEALQSLADSIKAQGVVQPIVVRPDGDGYEIVAGERRWRAAKLAGLDAIPALVRDVPDRTAMAVALIENIQREDLNPIEESLALRRLIDECELTHQQCAEAVGRSRAAVSNLLRLLELDAAVQSLVRDGRIEMGHARALLALPGNQQKQTADTVIAKGLSVRQTEALVRSLNEGKAKKPVPKKAGPNPHVHGLEKSLQDQLSAEVAIQHGAKGSGKVVIQYKSLDDLDRIVSSIK